MMTIEMLLEQLLEGGRFAIGELLVRRESGRYLVHHRAAEETSISRRSESVDDARVFARYDERGKYRPLKSAPNLAADWLLSLGSLAELRTALDDLYPAALGMLLARIEGRLDALDFMETAGRQTGMYRIVGRIEPAMAREVIGKTCAPDSCQRVILWNLAKDDPLNCLPDSKFEARRPASVADLKPAGLPDHPPMPVATIYCGEACNLLVAACRAAIKESQKAAAGQPPSTPHPSTSE